MLIGDRVRRKSYNQLFVRCETSVVFIKWIFLNYTLKSKIYEKIKQVLTLLIRISFLFALSGCEEENNWEKAHHLDYQD